MATMEEFAEELQSRDNSDDNCLIKFKTLLENSPCHVEDYFWGKEKDTFSEEGKDEEELYGHTILHLALCYKKYKTALAIAEKYPGLITQDVRGIKEHKPYRGLTPLHIAVSMGTCEVVEQLLRKSNKVPSKSAKLSSGKVSNKSNYGSVKQRVGPEPSDGCKTTGPIGERMKGTVFMGQLPFTVAVLSDISNLHPSSEDDHEMIQLLLKKTDCKLADTNYLGDTVLHSIMKYVTCFPADEARAAQVMKWLINKHISTEEHETTSQKISESDQNDHDPPDTNTSPNLSNTQKIGESDRNDHDPPDTNTSPNLSNTQKIDESDRNDHDPPDTNTSPNLSNTQKIGESDRNDHDPPDTNTSPNLGNTQKIGESDQNDHDPPDTNTSPNLSNTQKISESDQNDHDPPDTNTSPNLSNTQKISLNKILSIRNNDGKTAFQLAAESGHVTLYSYFLELSCLREPHDGVYQIGRYDITEIVKHSGSEKNILKGHAIEEMVCCQPLSVAIRMVFEDVFDKIVCHKWDKYKFGLLILFLTHFSVLTLLYLYALARARATEGWNWAPSNFLRACSIMYIGVATIYSLQELVRSVIAKQVMAWTAYHHNAVYRILTWVFSVSLFVDSVLCTSWNVNFFLFAAILSGTWNLMFFLRVVPYFGVYIVLINEALMKAVFPFVVLSSLQLCAFSVSLHCLFLHPDDEQEPIGEFETVGKSMLSMGKLIIGLTEFESLLKAKEDYLAVILFFIFILVGLLLLINALIGVMTNRFVDPQHDRLKVENLQKLSVIIYLEGWFVGCFFKCVQKLGKDKGGRDVFSYRKVPSSQADSPSGIEHRLRKEFKKTADTMRDIEKRMLCIEQKLESVLQNLGNSGNSASKIVLKDNITGQGDSLAPLITQLEKQEAYVSEMLEVMRSQDDREKTLHIYHYQQQ